MSFYRSRNKETPKLPITRTDIQLEGKWTQFVIADASLIMLIPPSTFTLAEFGVCVCMVVGSFGDSLVVGVNCSWT
jgi:hypothetical protein